MESKNILITGGSGFIGQHLAQKFIENNHKVTIVDINDPVDSIGTFIKGDVLDIEFLTNVTENKDIIVHLVALPVAGAAQKDPLKSFNLNIVTLQNILECCRKFDVQKLIFPSSAAVYGITEDLPIKENFPLNPTGIYSFHKVTCEKMIEAYAQNYGLQYAILRLFNVYGRGNKGVIDIFINKAKKGERIESFGPFQYRDFVYAGDVAEAMYHSAVYNKARNRVMNIGSGRGTQIKEVLELVCGLFPKAKWEEKKADFVMYDSISDITLAKILIDFDPGYGQEFMKEIILQEMV